MAIRKTILFQGDSVTDCRRDRADTSSLGMGYVPMIRNHFGDDPELRFINRGVGGDRVAHVRERWMQDCLVLSPDILVLFVGVNDVLVQMYENFLTPISEFEQDFKFLLDSTRAALPHTKIIVVEPFMQEISAEIAALKKHMPPLQRIEKRLAAEYGAVFLPLNSIFEGLAKTYARNLIAEDGIHPTPFGHYVIASQLIKILEKEIG